MVPENLFNLDTFSMMERRMEAVDAGSDVHKYPVREPPPQSSIAMEDAKATPPKRATKKVQRKRTKMPAEVKNDISRELTNLKKQNRGLQAQMGANEHTDEHRVSSQTQSIDEGFQPKTPLIDGLPTPELSDIEIDNYFCNCCQYDDRDRKVQQHS
jgi:hypothetical protein